MSALDRWGERKRRVAEAEEKAGEGTAHGRTENGRAAAGDGTAGDGGARAAFRPPSPDHAPGHPLDPDHPSDPGREAALAANRAAAEAVDLDALRPGSDLSAFFREGVPEALRARALKALWRSDPVFANVDRLCDYDDDFRAAAMVPGAIQSAWRAGRGYLFPEDAAEGGAGDAAAQEGAPADGSPNVAPSESGAPSEIGADPEPAVDAGPEATETVAVAVREPAPPPVAAADAPGARTDRDAREARRGTAPSLRARLGV